MSDKPATALSCEQTRDALEFYALDAVSRAERWEIESHLRGCAACAQEAARLAEAAAVLGRDLPLAPLPSGLRERVLSAAQAKPETIADPVDPVAPAHLVARAPRRLLSLPSRLRSLRWPRASLSAMAAAIAIVSLAWAVSLQAQLNLQQAEAARLADRADRYQRLVAVLESDQLHLIELSGTTDAPAAGGRMIVDPGSATGGLIVHDLPPLAPDRAYQVWFVSESGRESGGLVRPDASGEGYFFVRVPSDLTGIQTIGLTEEPATGSPGPTGPRVLGGQL